MNLLSAKKKIINEIFTKKWKCSDPDEAINATNKNNTISQEIYPDPLRFLLELFQNFDDSSLPMKCLNLTFTICDTFIIASHQGRPFDEHDVKSICYTGISTKLKEKNCTGNKGIGFKSVFMHSKKVIIISNGFSFRFDKEHFDNPHNCWNNDWGSLDNNYKDLKRPWQEIPLWTDEHELPDKNIIIPITKKFSNNFVFYFHSSKTLDSCKKFIYKVLDDPFYFLFLKCENIKIEINENGINKNLEKKFISDEKNISMLRINDNEPYYFFVNKYEEILNSRNLSHLELSLDESSAPEKFKEMKKIELSFGVQLEKINDNNFKIISLPKEKRLVYTLLPTCENFNFPFLLNANFYLDAGRTRIIEDPWNFIIFNCLPKYINKFVNTDLFKNFGNSFCECLLDEEQISILNQNFLNIFKQENFIYKDQMILFKTKSGNHQEISTCFLDTTNIQIDKNSYMEFLEILNLIYYDKAEILIKKYFESKNLIYDPSFKISKEDVDYANKLLKHYSKSKKYYIITNNELISFIESSIYKSYFFSPIVLKNLLFLIKNLKNYNISLFSDLKFIQNSNNEFKSPREFQILEDNNFSNCDVTLAKELFQITYDDIPIKYSSILTQEEKNTLKSLGVKIFSASSYIQNILDDFTNLYNLETSVKIVRILFEFVYSGNRGYESNQIFLQLSKCKFLSEKGEFMSMKSLHIGKFYFPESKCKFEEYGISSKYYKEGTNKKDWVDFFVKIGLVYQLEKVNIEFSEEEFIENPFYTKEYKDFILNSKNNFPLKLNAYPFLENLCDGNNLVNINSFFKNNWKKSSNRKKNYIPDFLEWYIVKDKKLIPNRYENLVPENEMYSIETINKELELYANQSNKMEIEKLLEEVLNFPCQNLNEMYLDELDLSSDLKITDRIKLMEKIRIKTSLRRSDDKLQILKNYFSKLFIELLLENPNYKYNDYMLDEELEFKLAKDLFYIDINKTDFLFTNSLENIYSKLHMPNFCEIISNNSRNYTKKYKYLLAERIDQQNVEIRKKYLNFCKKNGANIFLANDFHNEIEKIETGEKSEEIYNHLNKINFFQNLKQISEIVLKKKIILTNFSKNKLKFYPCSQIIIKSKNKIKFDLVAYMDYGGSRGSSNPNEYTIYYLQDETYTSWDHPTILYFIAKFIGIIINYDKADTEILTLLRQNPEFKVESLVSKCIKYDY